MQEVKLCLQGLKHTHTHQGRITSAEKHENSCWWFYMVMDHCLIPNPRNSHRQTLNTHLHKLPNPSYVPVLAACVVVCGCG